MNPLDFNNMIANLLVSLNGSLSTLTDSTGVLDTYATALNRGVVHFLSPRTLLILYDQLHILINHLDQIAYSLTLQLDVIQDIINQYLGELSPENLDSFRNINDQINNYIRRVQYFVDVFRDFENGLLLRGYINDISPDFLCESIHL